MPIWRYKNPSEAKQQKQKSNGRLKIKKQLKEKKIINGNNTAQYQFKRCTLNWDIKSLNRA